MAKGKTKNSELRRVMNMVKRLERDGYRMTKDLSELTIGKLRNIKSGRDLVRRGYAIFTEAGYVRLRREQNIRKLKEIIKRYGDKFGFKQSDLIRGISSLERDQFERIFSKRGAERIKFMQEMGLFNEGFRGPKPGSFGISELTGKKNYDSSGEHIPRSQKYNGSEATIQIDMLLSILEYGIDYSGSAMKDDKSAHVAVNESARKLQDIFNRARSRRSDEELLQNIIKDYGTVKHFATIVERLVLAIYDKEYHWGAGVSAYEADMHDVEETLLR